MYHPFPKGLVPIMNICLKTAHKIQPLYSYGEYAVFLKQTKHFFSPFCGPAMSITAFSIIVPAREPERACRVPEERPCVAAAAHVDRHRGDGEPRPCGGILTENGGRRVDSTLWPRAGNSIWEMKEMTYDIIKSNSVDKYRRKCHKDN